MSKATGALLILLIASNAAWFATWIRTDDVPPRRDLPRLQSSAGADRVRPSRESLPQSEGPPKHVQAPKSAFEQREITARSERWTSDLLMAEGPAQRRDVVERLAVALSSSNTTDTHAALSALARTWDISFDWAPLRDSIVALSRSEDPVIRELAVAKLIRFGEDEEILHMTRDLAKSPNPRIRRRASSIVSTASGGDFSKPVARETIEVLMQDADEMVASSALSALAQSKVPNELQAELLAEAIRVRRNEAEFVQVFRRVSPKSSAIIEYLLRALDSPDPHVRRMARGAFFDGVPPDWQGRVADAALRDLKRVSSPRQAMTSLRVVRRYGDAKHASELRRWLERQGISISVREEATRAIEVLERN